MIFVIGDTHFPFHQRQALSNAIDIISQKSRPYLNRLSTVHVVQIGDLFEQVVFSKHAKRYFIKPEKELGQARFNSESMWSKIRKISPKIQCHQILGNHDVRAIKRAQETLPEVQELVKQSLFNLYRFEHVKTYEDPRTPLWIKDVKFIHGYKKHGEHMKVSYTKTVVGHSHKGGVVYLNAELPGGKKRLIWELNAGWLGDELKYESIFGYTPERMSGWTLGLGLIDELGPRFIPLS